MPRSNAFTTICRLAAAVLPAVFIACESPTDIATPAGPEIMSVHVQNAPATLVVGETSQLTAQVRSADGSLLDRPVVWSTTDTLIATVTGDGLITARSAGSVEVRASAGGREAKVAVQINNGAPVIDALLPATAVVGTEGIELVISGSGFAPGAVVLWNGAERETRVVSATQIRADITAADLASAGLAAVRVANSPRWAATESNRLHFTIEPQPAPQGALYDLVGLDGTDGLPVEVQRTPVGGADGVLNLAVRRVLGGTLRTIPDSSGTRWEIALTIAAFDEVTGVEIRRDTLYWWGTLMYDLWTGNPILQVENLTLYNLQTEMRNEGGEWIVRQVVHTTGSPEHMKAWKYVKR